MSESKIPKPNDKPRITYMRDNHTFLQLSLDFKMAKRQLEDEFKNRLAHGIVGTSNNTTTPNKLMNNTVVNACGQENLDKFIKEVEEFYILYSPVDTNNIYKNNIDQINKHRIDSTTPLINNEDPYKTTLYPNITPNKDSIILNKEKHTLLTPSQLTPNKEKPKMKLTISYSETKRNIEGSFSICGTASDLRSLRDQINATLNQGFTYGWVNIYSDVPTTIEGAPVQWD